MNSQLRWIANPRASYLHVADRLRRGLLQANSEELAGLQRAAREIDAHCQTLAIRPDAFWEALIPLSAELTVESDSALVERLLSVLGAATPGQENQAETLLEALERIIVIASDTWPRMGEELRLRERPLREQWEVRGPGMMRRFARLTGQELVSGDVTIALVQPCLGGDGAAHPAFRFARIEAILTHPWPHLPETVRLGWLLGQLLTRDDTVLIEVPAERRGNIIALAALPLALEAGEYVEWSTLDRPTLELALSAWRPPLPQAMHPGEAANLLEAWIGALRDHRLNWSMALADLNQRAPW